MKTIQSILILVLSSFTFVACSDNDDTEGPKVIIELPTADTEFHYGDLITLRLTIEDKGGIEEFKYEVFPVEEVGEKFDMEQEEELLTYLTSFTNTFTISIPSQPSNTSFYDDGDYILKVTARDFSQYQTVQQVRISISNEETE